MADPNGKMLKKCARKTSEDDIDGDGRRSPRSSSSEQEPVGAGDLRKTVKKMEISQHSKYTCGFCGKVSF